MTKMPIYKTIIIDLHDFFTTLIFGSILLLKKASSALCDEYYSLTENGVPYKVFMYSEPGAKAEVRRFGMDKTNNGKIKCLHARLHEIYPTLKSKKYTLTWEDEEGDYIFIKTDDDIQTMINESMDPVFKLFVRCNGSSNDDEVEGSTAAISNAPSPKTCTGCLHEGIQCDVCGGAVVGYRYRCISCDDFDLCVRCERDGKHPEHCVVRVPVPNMPLPLIKASIKKSRKFLKSVASQAHDENKRLRRERVASRKSDTSAHQGKQDSQTGLNRNWVDIFGKYLEEFTNLAGDLNRQAENTEPAPAKPTATAEAGPSTATENTTMPNYEDIPNNPWNLPKEDIEKLQQACRHMRDNAVRASLKPITMAFNQVLEIATTVVKEATATPARASCLKGEESVNTNGDNPEREVPEQVAVNQKSEVAKPRQEPSLAESSATSGQESEVAKPRQEPSQADSFATSGQTVASGSKAPRLTDEQINENKRLTKAMMSKAMLNRCDMTDLNGAVAGARSEMASNASTCSSEGQASDRAEGWTVIDDAQMILDSANLEMHSNMHELPEESDQERIGSRPAKSVIYPDLNSATAVHDLHEGRQPNTASAQYQLIRNISPRTVAAIRQMEAMGFSNESGWLTQLLDVHNGNIATVLDLITPVVPSSRK